MQKTKKLFTAALMAILLASIGGCVYYARGPYVRGPYPAYYDCRYNRDC